MISKFVNAKPLTALTLASCFIYPSSIIALAGGFSEIGETFGWALMMFVWITSPLIILTFVFARAKSIYLRSISVLVLMVFALTRTLLIVRVLLDIQVEYEGIWLFTLPALENLVLTIAGAFALIDRRVGRDQN